MIDGGLSPKPTPTDRWSPLHVDVQQEAHVCAKEAETLELDVAESINGSIKAVSVAWRSDNKSFVLDDAKSFDSSTVSNELEKVSFLFIVLIAWHAITSSASFE